MSDAYTQSLLLFAYQRSARQLTDHLRARGHSQIRPKHGAIFGNVDRGGTRASVLARRAGMGKAAMSELIDEVERLGYVVRRPDPSDRRAKLVVPTASGVEVARLVHEFNVRTEARYRRALGAAAYGTLRASLELLAERRDVQPRVRA